MLQCIFLAGYIVCFFYIMQKRNIKTGTMWLTLSDKSDLPKYCNRTLLFRPEKRRKWQALHRKYNILCYLITRARFSGWGVGKKLFSTSYRVELQTFLIIFFNVIYAHFSTYTELKYACKHRIYKKDFCGRVERGFGVRGWGFKTRRNQLNTSKNVLYVM